jgi:ribonucleoside-triphosphate reductase (thioredoxin)
VKVYSKQVLNLTVQLSLNECQGRCVIIPINHAVTREVNKRGNMKLNETINNLSSLYDIPFKLSEDFISQYRGKEPEWGPVGWVTFSRTYARKLPNGQLEAYWQTVQRVVEGAFSILKWHFDLSEAESWTDDEINEEAERMYARIFEFKFTPSGRGFWVMGSEVLCHRGGAALNNCAFVSTKDIDNDFSRPFTFLMDSSMLGVGVGIDTRGANKMIVKAPRILDATYIVSDSREGWVSLIEHVLRGYAGEARCKNIDYSLVRPAGEPLKIFGGTASGPEPLIELVEELDLLLDPLVAERITSAAIGSIANLIGRCVVAGGIRRTAEMLLGFADDEEFVNLKDPTELNELFTQLNEETDEDRKSEIQHKIDRHPIVHHRWASNNTIYYNRGDDLSLLADLNMKSINIGAFWLDNAQDYGRMIDEPDQADSLALGTNPCGEQVLESFELCNLVESFPANHDSPEDYEITLRSAFLYGKIVTLIPTGFPETNDVITRNRRIGVSQSGIVTAMEKFGRDSYLQDYCDRQYKALKQYDVELSERFKISKSVRITSVKPSGTVSLLAGSTPGIHYPHAPFYIRNIRMNVNSPLLKLCEDAGYEVEDDLRAPNTKVVSFPISEDVSVGKSDVTARMQFQNCVDLQTWWADNAVSITITFREEEAAQLDGLIHEFAPYLKAISLLPHMDDRSMPQAPYISIDESAFMVLSSKVNTALTSNRSSELNLEHEVTDEFCDGDTCTL